MKSNYAELSAWNLQKKIHLIVPRALHREIFTKARHVVSPLFRKRDTPSRIKWHPAKQVFSN